MNLGLSNTDLNMDNHYTIADVEMSSFYSPKESKIAIERFNKKYFISAYHISDKTREDLKLFRLIERKIQSKGLISIMINNLIINR